MNNHEIMTKGITLLDSMLEGDIEEAIEALERALEAYQLILKYKRAINSLPKDLRIEKSVPRYRQHTTDHNDRVFKYLSQFDVGCELSRIAYAVDLTPQQVSSAIHVNKDMYIHVKHGVWKANNNHALHDNEVEPREDAVGDNPLQSPL